VKKGKDLGNRRSFCLEIQETVRARHHTQEVSLSASPLLSVSRPQSPESIGYRNRYGWQILTTSGWQLPDVLVQSSWSSLGTEKLLTDQTPYHEHPPN
jgi:hypothetical protein